MTTQVTYQGKPLVCSDCSATFEFTAQEQEFFASKGFTNEPKRCPTCRAARKAQQGGGNYNSFGGNSFGGNSYSSAPRQMYAIKCATCGKDAQVPFEPRSGKPVYCSDCYRKTNPVKRY
jgi:CxxC-x17-CxxC domain-containing protein